MLTENGIATTDDARKISFIRRHVAALDAARRAGVDVRATL